MVKNSNWQEANQLSWPRIWTRDYREQIQLAVSGGLQLRASELEVQHSNRSATPPPSQLPSVIQEILGYE